MDGSRAAVRLASLCTLLLATLAASAQTSIQPAKPAIATPVTSQSQSADPKSASTPTPTPHALDAADLEPFFDGIIPLQLERSDIAGASVLVMQGDKVLLQKGYGYADVKAKKPVDPETTLFRLASISKLFTWISVMQLQEQGRLDIDADVNRYLDFQIRPAFGKPVTLRNLMTHTGGFEESVNNIILTDPKRALTLRELLIQNQPERLFAPGTVPGYSNYGVGLAGYIVQRVSGEPFEQYVAEHIFQPLGMTHSTFQQPPQASLVKAPSEGYRGNTQKPAVGFEIFLPAPAGGISSTAADMGRFGQALLNGGELQGRRILKAETLQQMWTPQFRASDQMPPICMGFYENWRNGVHWIGHQGDLIAFHSLFYVEPARKLLVFASFNSAGSADKARPELMSMFTDRYFPGDAGQAFLQVPLDQMKDIEGTYQTTRRADSTRLKLTGLGSQVSASVDKEGILKITGSKDLREHDIRWKPIGKDLWQEVDGQRRIFAIRDGHGGVVRLAVDFPGVQLERVQWYEDARYVLSAVAAALLTLLAVVLAALIRTGRRILLRRRPRPAPQPGTQWLPVMTKLAATVWVVLILGTLICLISLGDELTPPTSAWTKYFVLINVVTGLALLLSLFPVVSGLAIWRQANLRRITRIKYSLVALACLLLSGFAIHWHLIGTTRI